MTETVAQPVVLDATVLSNFASSGATGELVAVLEQPVSVPAVQQELQRGYEQQYGFLEDALDCLGDDVPLLELENGDVETTELGTRLDSGEARALAGAVERDGTLATDDLAARRTASEYDVPVTGSVGVLVLGVRRDVLDVETANDWLATWKERRGYYAPVEGVESLLE